MNKVYVCKSQIINQFLNIFTRTEFIIVHCNHSMIPIGPISHNHFAAFIITIFGELKNSYIQLRIRTLGICAKFYSMYWSPSEVKFISITWWHCKIINFDLVKRRIKSYGTLEHFFLRSHNLFYMPMC